MARHDSKHSPPHALPRFLPVSLSPRLPMRREYKPSPVRSRLATLLLPAVLAGASFGCGRTDVFLPEGSAAEQMAYDVELARDVELDNAELAHVELVAPSPTAARAGLMGLTDGVPVEDVIAAVCPDGSPTVELDTTGEEPVIVIYMQDELRAVIWM